MVEPGIRRRPGKHAKGPVPEGNPPKHRPVHPKGRSSAGRLLAAGGALVAVVLAWMALLRGSGAAGELRPFSGPSLKGLPQFGNPHAEQLLWGTYRPGYYLGLRTRTPRSLLAGLMWMDPLRQDPLGNIRHEAQQRDGLAQYGWLQHDGRAYGLQRLLDERYNISAAWAKRLCAECGPGGDWGLRLAVEQRAEDEQGREDEVDDGDDEEEQPQAISVFIYLATEDGSPLQLDAGAVAATLQQGSAAPPRAAASGATPPLGAWQLHVRPGAGDGAAGVASVNHLGLATPHMHNLTEAVRGALLASVRAQHAAGERSYRLVLPDAAQAGPNVAVLQLTARLPLSLDLSFVSGLDSRGPSQPSSAAQLAQRVAAVSGAGLARLLAAGAATFQARFAAAFPALAAGNDSGAGLPEGTAAAAQAALSNMLGSMGYFYGHSLVRLQERRQGGQVAEATARLWDTALYSAVPSRSFFPRGFLWDEGFHQLLVRQWDAGLSREALAHWLDLMSARGWIAREQILGEEARARVPAEFVRQSPDAANPPTLFLLLSDMSRRVAAAAQAQQWGDEDRADAQFLAAAWPRLRTWYLWFNSTQAGPVPGAYRWRGRQAEAPQQQQRELNPKTLTSGLDDAPRASHPSGEERHVDLRCWMALAARALATIGANLGLPPKEVRPFVREAEWLEDFPRLNALHLHEPSGEYRDWGNHTEDVELQRPLVTLQDGRQVPAGDMQRVVTGAPPRPQLVPQFGYISLFPLLMRLVPPSSPVLGRQLELLRDPQRLWTDHGLRSLSRSASLYGRHNTEHDPPYWRGAIWINVNYLAVQALRHYGAQPGPHQRRAAELAQELRGNLVQCIVGEYRRTGYLWEQYDDQTGRGKGSHPFTGWTALVALLAADQ